MVESFLKGNTGSTTTATASATLDTPMASQPRATVLVFDPPPGYDYSLEKARLRRGQVQLEIPSGESATVQQLRVADVLLVHRLLATRATIAELVKCKG